MSRSYEDGLHLVSEYPRPSYQYSTLPQVYEPVEKVAAPLPQAFIASKSPESAPVPVDTENPPEYDGGRSSFASVGKMKAGPEPTKILGLKKRTALVTAAIIALLVIIALAIGLGVGLTRGNGRNDRTHVSSPTNASSDPASMTASLSAISSSSPTTNPSETSSQSATTTSASTVATSGFTGISAVECPSANNTAAYAGSSRFNILCAVHWVTGQPAANNNGTVQAVGNDKLVAYSLQQCLNYCVQYNNQLRTRVNPDQNGSGCLAVTYNANLTSAFASFQQNCFLKDRVGVYDPAADTTESAVLISA